MRAGLCGYANCIYQVGRLCTAATSQKNHECVIAGMNGEAHDPCRMRNPCLTRRFNFFFFSANL